jgi:hypothetical protein
MSLERCASRYKEEKWYLLPCDDVLLEVVIFSDEKSGIYERHKGQKRHQLSSRL